MADKRSRLSTFDFTLVIGGVGELDDACADALFVAGCDDATLGMSYGRVWLQFSREAATLQRAIVSALRDVRRAKIGAVVLQIDAANLVTQAEIARRARRTRQSVQQLVSGRRGPGGFPPPVAHLDDATPLWHWSDVARWLHQCNIVGPDVSRDAEFVAAINTALERARQLKENPKLVADATRAVAAV